MKVIYLIFLIFLITSCDKKEDTKYEKIGNHILIDGKGNPIQLPEDKLIVLNFMAYSCSACIEEIPIMKKVIQEEPYKNNFQIIAVVIDSDKEDLSDPLFPIYTNHKQNFVRFPVPGTPTTYIITPQGKKLVTIYGAVTEENFKKFLNEALEKFKKLNRSKTSSAGGFNPNFISFT
ncbi:TlpA family protein disulfide reductase [Persephonella sp.]